jgi:hypothetical protein
MNKLAIFNDLYDAAIEESRRFNPVAGTAFDQKARQQVMDDRWRMRNALRAQDGLPPLRRKIVPAGDVWSSLERSINNRLQGPTARAELMRTLELGRNMLGAHPNSVGQVLIEPAVATVGPEEVKTQPKRTRNRNERPVKTERDQFVPRLPRNQSTVMLTTPQPEIAAHEFGHAKDTAILGRLPQDTLRNEATATQYANQALGGRSPLLTSALGTYIAGRGARPIVQSDPVSSAVVGETFAPVHTNQAMVSRADESIQRAPSVRRRRPREALRDRIAARSELNASQRALNNPLLAPQVYGPLPAQNPAVVHQLEASLGPGAWAEAQAHAEQMRQRNLAQPRPEVAAAYQSARVPMPPPQVPGNQTIVPQARVPSVGLRNFLRRGR